MLEKLKKQFAEHKEEIIITAVVAGSLAAYGFACYKLGISAGKLPDFLMTNFFEEGGKKFMVLNGKVYEKVM
jgi:hypothetical protein